MNFNLTKRELEVVGLIAKGYADVKISKELCITRTTVRAHIKNIYTKMGLFKTDEKDYNIRVLLVKKYYERNFMV